MSIRALRNDSTTALEVLMQNIQSVTVFDKDAILYLKLTDSSIVQLHNGKYAISSQGQGAKHFLESKVEGAELFYEIQSEDFKKLLAASVSKVRIYTSKGYYEGSPKKRTKKLL